MSAITQIPAPTLPAGYALHTGYPPVDTYVNMRIVTGLTPVTSDQATASIAGSWYGCYVTHTPTPPTTKEDDDEDDAKQPPAEIVAMGRIIADGGWYFIVADMAVLPDHQRRGLGAVVLRRLLDTVEARAPRGKAVVSLIAGVPGRKLYGNFGFTDGMPTALGMLTVLNVDGGGGGCGGVSSEESKDAILKKVEQVLD